MANLSDVNGFIRVDNIGKEFKKFVEAVQDGEGGAYYLLVDRDDLTDATVTHRDGLKIKFSTYGRWNYASNLKGYLGGEWMKKDRERAAYQKLLQAIKDKDGSIFVDYTDGEQDWKEKGQASLKLVDGKVTFNLEREDIR